MLLEHKKHTMSNNTQCIACEELKSLPIGLLLHSVLYVFVCLCKEMQSANPAQWFVVTAETATKLIVCLSVQFCEQHV